MCYTSCEHVTMNYKYVAEYRSNIRMTNHLESTMLQDVININPIVTHLSNFK